MCKRCPGDANDPTGCGLISCGFFTLVGISLYTVGVVFETEKQACFERCCWVSSVAENVGSSQICGRQGEHCRSNCASFVDLDAKSVKLRICKERCQADCAEAARRQNHPDADRERVVCHADCQNFCEYESGYFIARLAMDECQAKRQCVELLSEELTAFEYCTDHRNCLWSLRGSFIVIEALAVIAATYSLSLYKQAFCCWHNQSCTAADVFGRVCWIFGIVLASWCAALLALNTEDPDDFNALLVVIIIVAGVACTGLCCSRFVLSPDDSEIEKSWSL